MLFDKILRFSTTSWNLTSSDTETFFAKQQDFSVIAG
jgi:hypothetical protein